MRITRVITGSSHSSPAKLPDRPDREAIQVGDGIGAEPLLPALVLRMGWAIGHRQPSPLGGLTGSAGPVGAADALDIAVLAVADAESGALGAADDRPGQVVDRRLRLSLLSSATTALPKVAYSSLAAHQVASWTRPARRSGAHGGPLAILIRLHVPVLYRRLRPSGLDWAAASASWAPFRERYGHRDQ
jgi:hypothetical protein